MKKNTPKSDKKYSHLSLEEREEIAIGLENGMKQGEIALTIGRSPSTISRELQKKPNSAYNRSWIPEAVETIIVALFDKGFILNETFDFEFFE